MHPLFHIAGIKLEYVKSNLWRQRGRVVSVAGFVPGSHWFSSFFLIQSQFDSLILLDVISTVCFIGPEKPLRGIGQSSKLSHLRADNSHILPF